MKPKKLKKKRKKALRRVQDAITAVLDLGPHHPTPENVASIQAIHNTVCRIRRVWQDQTSGADSLADAVVAHMRTSLMQSLKEMTADEFPAELNVPDPPSGPPSAN